VRWIRHFRKALTNQWFRKQGATLANFILCCQKIFMPKNLSLKFIYICTDDQGDFGQFLHFISLVATIREYITAIWSVAI